MARKLAKRTPTHRAFPAKRKRNSKPQKPVKLQAQPKLQEQSKLPEQPKRKFQYSVFDPFGAMKTIKIPVEVLIKDDLVDLLKMLKRRMRTTVTFNEGRTTQAEVRMNYRVFWELFRVFKDVEEKPILVEASGKRYSGKNKPYRTLEIKVFGHGLLVDTMKKLGVGNINQYLEKTFEVGFFTGKVQVSIEKPFEMTFSSTTRTATMKAHYQIVNEFGIVV